MRRGRTFMTTGPVVEFGVEDQDIGGEVELPRPADVRVHARAVFDPMQDDLAVLELVQNGDVIERVSRAAGASEIAISTRQRVDQSPWFAVRGYGSKREITLAKPMHFSALGPTSNLHTAPIWVTVAGAAPLEKSEQARRVAREWLARTR